ncbi:hypothetical protein B0H11DRAFT_2230639 [Mycena galericulata]|nr:hypothetical protein B0H11DRAFT_2230639 [Mycena galericulata]
MGEEPKRGILLYPCSLPLTSGQLLAIIRPPPVPPVPPELRSLTGASGLDFALLVLLRYLRSSSSIPDYLPVKVVAHPLPPVVLRSLVYSPDPPSDLRYLRPLPDLRHLRHFRSSIPGSVYNNLPNWITAFSHRGDDVWSPWVFNSFVEKFIAVIRTIWVLDWDPPYKFRNSSEESWALAIEALSNVWQSFAFTPTPVRLFIQLSKSTVLVSFKMVYYPRLWEKNALSSPLRAIFASKLGTSLLKAAQIASNTISATNTGLENTNIQQIAQFLDALGGKIGTDFEPGSGEVEISGETKAYQNWGELRKHFNAELNRLEELWKDTRTLHRQSAHT